MKYNFINKMMREPITAATAIGMGIQAAAAGGQIYAQGKMNKKTREWNEKMYGIQRKDALEDRDYNSSEQQVERLKAAGLNPALLYGQSGATGATMTRGSEVGSWNPQTPPISGMGIAAAQSIAQLELLKAQKNNIDADTKNKLGDAANKPLVGKNIEASTLNLTQGVEESKAKTTLLGVEKDIQEIERTIKDSSMNDVISTIYQEQKIAYETMRSLKLQNKMTEETWKDKVATVKAQLGLLIAQKAGIEQGIEVDKARVTQILTGIVQEWQHLYNEGNDVSERMRNGANQRWVNDVSEQTKLSYEAVEKMLTAIGIGSVGGSTIHNYGDTHIKNKK